MWGYLTETDALYTWSFYALLGWIQVITTLIGILLVWLIYATMVMRFRWIPSTLDLIFPFIVGILEFMLIATLAPANAGLWFITMGVVFGAMTWSSQTTLRRARQDRENEIYFKGTNPADWRDFVTPLVTVSTMIAVGIYLWQTGNQGLVLLIALLGALTSLGIQMWLTDKFWQRTFERLPGDQPSS